MSGLALIGGGLLLFALLVLPVVAVCKLLGAAAHVTCAVTAGAISGPAGMVHTDRTARLSAAAIAAQRAADRA